MKRGLLLVLVACSTRSAPEVAGVGSATALGLEEPPLTAAHGAQIELLAITDDGSAVVTQDAVGATRLWPTLDGTREPIVVHIATATSLAIGRDGDSYVIAALDEGGGAELVRLANNGAVITRTSIAPEPPIESITIASQGLIAARADQTLAIFDASGAQVGRLEAPAGKRIHFVIARGTRTLVLLSAQLDKGHALHGRWLDGERWGSDTPALAIDPRFLDTEPRSSPALSPRGDRLTVDFETEPYLFDLATGRSLAKFEIVSFVGFVDGDTLATVHPQFPSVQPGVPEKILWRKRTKGSSFEKYGEEASHSSLPMAVGDGVIVSAHGGSLALHTPEGVRQLGYGIADVQGMHVDGERVIVAAGVLAATLDAALEPHAWFALPTDGRTLVDVQPIDAQFALASHTLGEQPWSSVSVLDLAGNQTQQVLQHAIARGELRYDPTTRLLEVTDSAASYLTRWDPQQHKFDIWYRLAGGAADVHLLDPARNDGLVALALTATDGTLDIGEIHGADLEVGAPVEARHWYRVNGRGVAVDRRGNVYVIEHGNLVVYRAGMRVADIAEVGDARVTPRPDGTYIAIYGDNRIRMYDATGAQIWLLAAPLAQRIAWLGDELVVDYAGGLGKIDAATGALIKRTCGWSFGIGALSTNDQLQLAGDSICDAP
ncbi:MAG TPA: hypothetical protein VIV11_37895 [Kofleriaceae bacterium]